MPKVRNCADSKMRAAFPRDASREARATGGCGQPRATTHILHLLAPLAVAVPEFRRTADLAHKLIPQRSLCLSGKHSRRRHEARPPVASSRRPFNLATATQNAHLVPRNPTSFVLDLRIRARSQEDLPRSGIFCETYLLVYNMNKKLRRCATLLPITFDIVVQKSSHKTPEAGQRFGLNFEPKSHVTGILGPSGSGRGSKFS